MPGRKRKSDNRALTLQTLSEASPWCAEHLKLVAQGLIETNSYRMDACKYIINQDLGMPRQKNETAVSGRIEVIWDGNEHISGSSGNEAAENAGK